MTTGQPLKIAIVSGEESGDLLGADVVRALARRTGREIKLVGVGGRHLMELGLKPPFDASDIALVGVTAILRDLPRLIRRIGETARMICAEKPDCLITIDSPDFTLRVAKKVRASCPEIPIVHYVCPSVWAWRPGRARAMLPRVDHILCLLPFEPAELERLGGPKGTFVGHRLSHDPHVITAAAAQRQRVEHSGQKTLLLLPGSRKSEVRGLIDVFGQTVSVLRGRGHNLRLVLPTVPHVAELVHASVANWPEKPEILLGAEDKWRAFGEADAALIASGTVSLELALAGVPFVSCYSVDAVMKVAKRLIKSWSALLPNLIADRPVAFEAYESYLRPGYLARTLEPLLAETSLRRWQKEGFEEVRRRMATDEPSGDIASGIVVDAIAGRRN